LDDVAWEWVPELPGSKKKYKLYYLANEKVKL